MTKEDNEATGAQGIRDAAISVGPGSGRQESAQKGSEDKKGPPHGGEMAVREHHRKMYEQKCLDFENLRLAT